MENFGQYVPVIVAVIIMLFIILIYSQWKWGRVVASHVQVIVRGSDGGGRYELAPQDGGSVSLKNPYNDTVRLWPINALATIDLPYPGNGAVPTFLQKSIRTVMVDEEDWEPLLNRSPYKEKIASPDIIRYIQELATRVSDDELQQELVVLAEELSPSPTREMIASPAVLGNLINEKITEAVITVNKETIDTLKGLVNRIANMLTANLFWIGIAVVAVIGIVGIVLTVLTRTDVGLIKTAIGAVGG